MQGRYVSLSKSLSTSIPTSWLLCKTRPLPAQVLFTLCCDVALSSTFHQLQVIRGDLTKQEVTAIVHPTDKYLSLGGDASSCIAKAVGKPFYQGCQALMSNTSLPCLEGNCFIMPCNGSQPFQNIIHAAGPCYNGEHDQYQVKARCPLRSITPPAMTLVRKSKACRADTYYAVQLL